MPSATVPVLPCGKLGLKLSKQGLGCMGMSFGYGEPLDDDAARAVLDRALELGVTHLDTALLYAHGLNEELLGRCIKGQRDKFTIATKCGVFIKDGQNGNDGSRKHVREACEASLKRLGVDYIDLFYLHRVDPKTPVEESFAEMKALRDEGKIKYVGISEASVDEIRRAHAVCPLSANQIEWSLWSRNSEAEVIPTCRELGIGIVVYSPLGRGFLTGAYNSPDDFIKTDWRRRNPRFQEEAMKQNVLLLEAVKAMAARKGCTPGQLALAWVHAQGDDVFPIPGTKRTQYLEENVQALGVQLSAEEKAELDNLEMHKKAAGTAY